MEPITETTTQPCNNNIANVKLIQIQSLLEWISLLSSPMEWILSTLLFLFEQKRYQQYQQWSAWISCFWVSQFSWENTLKAICPAHEDYRIANLGRAGASWVQPPVAASIPSAVALTDAQPGSLSFKMIKEVILKKKVKFYILSPANLSTLF